MLKGDGTANPAQTFPGKPEFNRLQSLDLTMIKGAGQCCPGTKAFSPIPSKSPRFSARNAINGKKRHTGL